MKILLPLSLSLFLLAGCNTNSSLQPDEVLLDQSQNRQGERPAGLDDIVNAPAENPFRVQEAEALEDLVESLQVSRAETREAVYIGQQEITLLNGPSSDALPSGQRVSPRERLQIFWPTRVTNNYIKVKIDGDESAWLRYRISDTSEPQVILLEDYIIPVVSISDSRLVVVTYEEEPEETDEVAEAIVLNTSTEEVRIITPAPVTQPEAEEEVVESPVEIDLNPSQLDPSPESESRLQEPGPIPSKMGTAAEVEAELEIQPEQPQQVEISIEPSTEVDLENTSRLAPSSSVRPQARPGSASEDTLSAQAPRATPNKMETVEEVEVQLNVETEQPQIEISLEPAPAFDSENVSELAPGNSARPQARPHDLDTSRPPLSSAVGLSSEELLAALGIEPVSIYRESSYLATSRARVSEVFPRAVETFSGCTFNPGQGPNANNNRCYRELILSEEFTDFIADQGMSCLNEASRLVFDREPLKFLLRTNGGSVNRTNRRSLHHRGIALDVFKVSLYFREGVNSEEIIFHKNRTGGESIQERRNRTFYWAFESCWRGKIQQYHQTRSCGSEGTGVLTYEFDRFHEDHMHISLPACEDVKNRFNLMGT